ncbi:exodeoxyribonuclease III [Candidatus Blochmannia ocreatus (nom. nud.)]|uniref:Exodeoxyribonuclease III n=1 Tax=Candidatus Blochmannia ocreatus (nom. nud.) TaxID=251538 RepID=A0ABY4SYL6_9ENTR|nr:exodeoxyribonuclease III [Candidatus Blochmannia ocreatus]URJ24934.1 exodeoxyribonuclease III [Candidatus Blochmannia ocreatus]
MRFVSFNINGIRAHIHQLNSIINKLKPDVIGLQETKVHDDSFPIKEISQYGYYVYFYGQKKYHGVALFLKKKPISVLYGFNDDNQLSQKRIITANIATPIGNLTIINAYFPQGENRNHEEKFGYKKYFYEKLQTHIELSYNNNALLLIMGDMNISPTDYDIGINDKNKQNWIQTGRCSFLPEERKWINNLINWGLIDIYRKLHPQNKKRYSWFSYQSNSFKNNIGLRIDLILVTHPLANLCESIGICYNIRNMHKPSDHAPIYADFYLS